jgi:Tfp pilus assembly protein PilF
LISAYRAVNRDADAVNLLSRALAKNRKDTDALLQRAELAVENGKYSDAEVDINQVLRFNSASAPGHYLLAKINEARGAELRYRQELSEAVRLSPYSLPVRFELANHFVSTNAAAAALEVLDGAADAQKRTTPFVVQRNWALWAAGDLQELRKGIDNGLGRERSGELLLQDGLWRLRSNDVAGARKSLEEALKINPRDLRALTAVRQSYLMQKQGQLAVRKIKEFAAQHPESAPAQEFLGSVLMAAGEYVQARAALTTAEAAVGDSRAKINLARLDIVEHNWDNAAGRLKKVLSADSNNTTLRLWLGFVEAARGDQEAALGHFREVVKLSPGNADGLNNLAYLLADYKKQPDEALPYAERAKELSPDDPEIADTLGWVLYQKGLYPSAIQHLERAVAKGQNPTSRSHLAMAYAKAGEVKRARTILAPLLKQYPNSADAKLALTVVGN